MSRGRNIIQLLKAVDCIGQAQGATISDLEDALGVSRRAVYRMLDIIEALGFPIYDDKEADERKKRWKFEEGYLQALPNIAVPDMKLTPEEVVALYFLKGDTTPFAGTEIQAAMNTAFSKIEATLPTALFRQLDTLKAIFTPTGKYAKDYSGKGDIIEELTQAMLERRVCEVTYHAVSKDDPSTYAIEPLHFFEFNSGLYCFVKVCKYGDIRMLAVERIQDLSVMDDTFCYPDDFDPAKTLQSTFGIILDERFTVRIRFAPKVAIYIRERRWAAEQSIEELEDGSIILEMTTSGWSEVKHWVLSYGASAEVLEPQEMRKELEEEAKQLVAIYS